MLNCLFHPLTLVIKTSTSNGSLFYRLLEEHWIRCGKELNQWELLQEFGCSPECLNYQLVLESAWRTPNWVVVRDALTQLEQACPKEYAWKVGASFQLVDILIYHFFKFPC